MNNSVGEVLIDVELNNKNLKNQVKNSTGQVENAFSSSMKKVGMFIASAFAVKQVVSFTKEAVNSASKVQSAWTGLNSIVQGTGNSFDKAKDFLQEFTSDGLTTISEATTAYKNLLSRGYDTTQIENTMKALKDSAAFGRQASYDLGEAIVTATEGLKNENSILVDNAGVTKNVAKMWQEYADSIGVSSTSLTQAQKIQAEYNGIMKETRFQFGDASAYTQTFAGQMQKLKATFNNMKVAIGKVVAPLSQLFIPIINNALIAVTNLFNSLQVILKTFGLEMPDVISKASTGISSSIDSAKKSMTEEGNEAVKTAKKINKAFGSLDEINTLNSNKDTSSAAGSSNEISSLPIDEYSTNAINSTSKIESAFLKLKDKLSSIWNSEPIQAFVNAMISSFDFGFNMISTLGQNLITNFNNTWDNISLNLETTLSNMSNLWTIFWKDIDDGIYVWGEPIIEGVNGVFNSIWKDAIDPFINLVTKIWADFSGILVKLWDKHGEKLINNIGEFVTNTIKHFQSIWDNIIEPIIKPFLEMLSWLWDKHLSKLVYAIGDFVGTLINNALEIYNKFIYPIQSWLMEKLAPTFKFTSSLIIDCFGTVIGVISDLISSAMKKLTGIINFITGIFTGNWSKAWDGVKDIFTGIWESLTGVVKGAVNFIIDGLNGFIRAANEISFDVPDWVPVIGGKKWGFNLSTIPKLAQGGYVEANNPQLAIVGDNKKEGEIISPESKIDEAVERGINKALSKINNINSSSNKPFEMLIRVEYEDGKKIIKKINQTQIEEGEILLLV